MKETIRNIAFAGLLGVSALVGCGESVKAGGGCPDKESCQEEWPFAVTAGRTFESHPDYDIWAYTNSPVLRLDSKTRFFFWPTSTGAKKGIERIAQQCQVIGSMRVEFATDSTYAVAVVDPGCMTARP